MSNVYVYRGHVLQYTYCGTFGFWSWDPEGYCVGGESLSETLLLVDVILDELLRE